MTARQLTRRALSFGLSFVVALSGVPAQALAEMSEQTVVVQDVTTGDDVQAEEHPVPPLPRRLRIIRPQMTAK